jgi:hypothetical protein
MSCIGVFKMVGIVEVVVSWIELGRVDGCLMVVECVELGKERHNMMEASIYYIAAFLQTLTHLLLFKMYFVLLLHNQKDFRTKTNYCYMSALRN